MICAVDLFVEGRNVAAELVKYAHNAAELLAHNAAELLAHNAAKQLEKRASNKSIAKMMKCNITHVMDSEFEGSSEQLQAGTEKCASGEYPAQCRVKRMYVHV